jgi:hypothetical protein
MLMLTLSNGSSKQLQATPAFTASVDAAVTIRVHNTCAHACKYTECDQAHLAVLELVREWREVPRLHLVAPELDALNVLDLGKLLVLADLGHVKVAVLGAVVVLVLALLDAAARVRGVQCEVRRCLVLCCRGCHAAEVLAGGGLGAHRLRT